jgi:hypothetical protein
MVAGEGGASFNSAAGGLCARCGQRVGAPCAADSTAPCAADSTATAVSAWCDRCVSIQRAEVMVDFEVKYQAWSVRMARHEEVSWAMLVARARDTGQELPRRTDAVAGFPPAGPPAPRCSDS